jgi:hypothetical protein
MYVSLRSLSPSGTFDPVEISERTDTEHRNGVYLNSERIEAIAELFNDPIPRLSASHQDLPQVPFIVNGALSNAHNTTQ